MKIVHFIVAIAIAVAVAVTSGRAEEIDTLPAQGAATAWLAAVDGGAYGDSWERGAEFFRKAVTKQDWEKALVAVRSPLGAASSRKVRSVIYTRNLPNAPEGEYVVIQYDTMFENRPSVETVTPVREKDGAWRVSGYFIR